MRQSLIKGQGREVCMCVHACVCVKLNVFNYFFVIFDNILDIEKQWKGFN